MSASPAGPLWAFSPAEWRLLAITFAGGLGSLVVAACFIGGAIALARSQEQFGLGNAALVTAATVTASALMLIQLRGFHTRKRGERESISGSSLRWAPSLLFLC